MAKRTNDIAALDVSIKRWKTRLKRSVTMIDKLEQKRKRMQGRAITETGVEFNIPLKGIKKPAKLAVMFEPAKLVDDPVVKEMKANLEAALLAQNPDLGIPNFLKRKPDTVAAEEIKAEQAETKKAKAAGRIAKMKAKKAGDLKKMPLSGKAALDYIKG